MKVNQLFYRVGLLSLIFSVARASDTISLYQVVLQLDNNNNVQITPLDSNNQLKIDASSAQPTIESETSTAYRDNIGNSFDAKSLSGTISTNSAVIKTVQEDTIIFVMSDGAQLISSAVLYNANLGINADTLASQAAAMNTTIFGWLQAIVNNGSLASDLQKIAAVQLNPTQCNNNSICFYSDELVSVQSALSQYAKNLPNGLYTLITTASTNTSASTTSGQTSGSLVYNVLLKLIAAYLYNQSANKNKFSVTSCGYNNYSEISAQIQAINSQVATAKANLNTAAGNLLTCLQSKDGITADDASAPAACDPVNNPVACVPAYLSASVTNNTTNNCGSLVQAYADALTAINTAIYSMYQLVAAYPKTIADAGSIATNTNYLKGFTVGTQTLSGCSTNGNPIAVVFGTNASLQQNGSLNYGQTSSYGVYKTYSYKTVTQTDAQGNALQQVVEYDENGDYAGSALFFKDGNPVTGSNGNYVTNYYLKSDGTVAQSCSSCAPVVLAPQGIQLGAPASQCSSTNSSACSPISISPKAIYNTVCLVQGDIAQQLYNVSQDCGGLLSANDLTTLDKAQTTAVKNQQKAQDAENATVWNTANNMALMPILFPIAGMIVEKIKSLIEGRLAVSQGAKKLGISPEQYKELQSKGELESYENIKEFNDKYGLELSPEQMMDAAEVSKSFDLKPGQAANLAKLPPEQLETAKSLLAEGKSYGEAFSQAKSQQAKQAYESADKPTTSSEITGADQALPEGSKTSAEITDTAGSVTTTIDSTQKIGGGDTFVSDTPIATDTGFGDTGVKDEPAFENVTGEDSGISPTESLPEIEE